MPHRLSVFNLFFILGLLTGCATAPEPVHEVRPENATASQPLQSAPAPKDVYLLRLNLGPDTQGMRGVEWSQIEMDAQTLFYEDDEVSRRSTRSLRARIKSEIQVESRSSLLIKNTTTEKIGNHSLRAFGLPELGETLEMKLNSLGRVTHVSGMPKDSVYYLPPVLLPEQAVTVGDTWGETFRWKGEGQTEFLITTMTCRWTGIEKWKGSRVFRIEVIARSAFEHPVEAMTLESRSKGFFLWDPIRGIVVYSESSGTDTLTSDENKVVFVTKSDYSSENVTASEEVF